MARAAFEVWGAGAVTVAPYLGGDSVAPFTDYAERAVFVLCHTSNPGAAELQTLEHDGEPLYLRVARLSQGWSKTDNVGLVVGATYPEALARGARRARPMPGSWCRASAHRAATWRPRSLPDCAPTGWAW